jgi:nitrate reductase (cytochrome), electron transfer subunit
MGPQPLPGRVLRRRLGLIVVSVVVMGGGIVLMPPIGMPAIDPPGPGILVPEPPIPAEADVFRLTAADIAAGATQAPRTGARARTLAAFRALRAYPGAPPRIPHALAPEEFRGTTCNTCHGRGGYSARFDAYAPITPHPEFRNCLQCHAADDGNVGVAVRGRVFNGDAAATRTPRASVAPLVAIDWKTTSWPSTNLRAMNGSPPAVPHTLELRGNCLACHGGPGAVAEIRTTHPERANCRQCHVPATYDVEDDAFTRPTTRGASAGSSR